MRCYESRLLSRDGSVSKTVGSVVIETRTAVPKILPGYRREEDILGKE